MSERLSPEQRDKQRVECLLLLDPHRFEVWKYFEERADRLGEQLWSTGTWLLGLVGATLSLPFVAQFITVSGTSLPAVKEKYLLMSIAVAGLVVCLYAFLALDDIRRHIMSNWRRAALAQESAKEPSWGGQKRFGWTVLIAALVLAGLSFMALFVLAARS